MKPRNKFEQAVLAQSKYLRPITKAQTQWAFRECIDHYAYRLPKGNTTCMDCGHSWQIIEPTEHCTCPQCGADLEVITTRARKLKQRQYFTVLTTSGGYQVLRMYKKENETSLSSVLYTTYNQRVRRWRRGKRIALTA